MTNFMPSIAPFSVLAFLGTGLVLMVCVLAALCAVASRSKRRLAIAARLRSSGAGYRHGCVAGIFLVHS